MSRIRKLQLFIGKLPVLQQIIALCKKFSFPGFQKVSIHDVVVFFFREVKKEKLNVRAGFIAFNSTLAIFPTIMFLLSIVPYKLVLQMKKAILNNLSTLMPKDALGFVEDLIFGLELSSHSLWFTIFNAILLLYFASSSMIAVQNSFRKQYAGFRKRSIFERRLLAVFFTLVILTLFIAATTISIGGPTLINKVAHLAGFSDTALRPILVVFNKLISIVLVLITFSFILKFVPPIKIKMAFFSPGAILATILSIITSIGFGWYVSNFASYNKLYGSIGALIVLMLFIYINALTLLVGFELNTSIEVNKNQIVFDKEEVVSED